MEITREGRESIVTERNKGLSIIGYMRKSGWAVTDYGYKIVAEKKE